jgi:hypothetical protein
MTCGTAAKQQNLAQAAELMVRTRMRRFICGSNRNRMLSGKRSGCGVHIDLGPETVSACPSDSGRGPALRLGLPAGDTQSAPWGWRNEHTRPPSGQAIEPRGLGNGNLAICGWRTSTNRSAPETRDYHLIMRLFKFNGWLLTGLETNSAVRSLVRDPRIPARAITRDGFVAIYGFSLTMWGDRSIWSG